MGVRALLLTAVLLIEPALAQSPPTVAFPREYKSRLVKYAVVDRADGFSRDLYASKAAVDALKQNPKLQEFPVGALFAIDVYSAALLGRDRKSQAPIFRTMSDGHLAREKDERTLHLMQKTQPGFGSQTWTFAGFDPRTAAPLPLQLPGDCLLCHQAAVVSDMSFSLSLLRRYATTGAVQYSYCAHPGRQACAF